MKAALLLFCTLNEGFGVGILFLSKARDRGGSEQALACDSTDDGAATPHRERIHAIWRRDFVPEQGVRQRRK